MSDAAAPMAIESHHNDAERLDAARFDPETQIVERGREPARHKGPHDGDAAAVEQVEQEDGERHVEYQRGQHHLEVEARNRRDIGRHGLRHPPVLVPRAEQVNRHSPDDPGESGHGKPTIESRR